MLPLDWSQEFSFKYADAVDPNFESQKLPKKHAYRGERGGCALVMRCASK